MTLAENMLTVRCDTLYLLCPGQGSNHIPWYTCGSAYHYPTAPPPNVHGSNALFSTTIVDKHI